MNELPVVCTLTPETMAIRRAELLSALVGRAEHVEHLADGLRLRFSASTDILSAIATTIAAERHCSRFLRFEVTVEPDAGPVYLSLRGPDGTGDFLTALMG